MEKPNSHKLSCVEIRHSFEIPFQSLFYVEEYLKLLCHLNIFHHGEIYLDGRAISSIPPHKRGIGMVFQNYALFPHMTVYENLAFPLRVRKIPKDEADKKIDKALSMVSLQGFASRCEALKRYHR